MHSTIYEKHRKKNLVKNSFLLQRDPRLIIDVRDEMRKECERFGIVKKVMIFDVSIGFHLICSV